MKYLFQSVSAEEHLTKFIFEVGSTQTLISVELEEEFEKTTKELFSAFCKGLPICIKIFKIARDNNAPIGQESKWIKAQNNTITEAEIKAYEDFPDKNLTYTKFTNTHNEENHEISQNTNEVRTEMLEDTRNSLALIESLAIKLNLDPEQIITDVEKDNVKKTTADVIKK